MLGLRRIATGPIGRFLLGGASTTLVSYAAYLVLLAFLPYLAAYWVAYAIGVAWSYFANTLFVFRQRPSLARALAFPLVYAIQLAAGSLLMVVFVRHFGLPAKVAPLLVVVLTLPLTYVASRWIVTTPRIFQGAATVSSEGRAVSSRIPAWVDDAVAALFSIAVGACVFLSWPLDLHTPILLAGDATSADYIFKSILEHGSYTRNPDVGAPFGATMYDYPIPEPTHHAFIRLIGLFSKDPFVAFNVFYLLGFAAAAFTACWALRSSGIRRPFAIAGAIAFSLLPYHFMRLGHIFLASYAAIPVFGYYALRLATYRAPHVPGSARIGWLPVLAIALAAGTGVYYAWFGLLFIVFAAALGSARSRLWQPLRIGTVYAATVVAVVAFALLPNAIYHLAEGSNAAAVAARLPQESEIYGLRITQLLFPTPGHRIAAFSAFMSAYQQSAPNVNENLTAALGGIGSLGFIVALGALFFGDERRHAGLWAAGAACVAAVLYATIGGFGAIVGRLLTPDLRGLNRISVFIAFFALYAFFAAVETATRGRRRVGVETACAIALVAVACFDQIPTHLSHQNAEALAPRSALYARMRAALPDGARVFELPYTYFPESPHPVGSYGLLEPYLFTNGLKWSFGDMRGRPADVWNEQVAALGGKEFSDALARAGFAAVYVDRRGYKDGGAALEQDLRTQFGAPIVEDKDLARALYRVPAARPDMVPHVAVEFGRGWSTSKGPAGSDVMSTAAGDADLVVANPVPSPVPVALRFHVASTTPRKFVVSYADQVIAVHSLHAGEGVEIPVSIDTRPGVSRLSFRSEAPAVSAGNEQATASTIRVTGLSWGVRERL
jgi:phosphoglycerol transferase